MTDVTELLARLKDLAAQIKGDETGFVTGTYYAESVNAIAPLAAEIERLTKDVARLEWLEKATTEEHPHVPYFDTGKWRYTYLVSNAGGFGGGVGEASFDTLREAIDAATIETGAP